MIKNRLTDIITTSLVTFVWLNTIGYVFVPLITFFKFFLNYIITASVTPDRPTAHPTPPPFPTQPIPPTRFGAVVDQTLKPSIHFRVMYVAKTFSFRIYPNQTLQHLHNKTNEFTGLG